MKLSLRGEYALRALVVLGDDYGSGVVPIRSISARQDIPKRFLEQILNDLRAGGFVESKRGVAGGYRLARPPEEITLAPVIRHVEGSLGPVSARSGRVPRLPPAADAAQGALRSVVEEVNNAMTRVLETVTIADLCERARQLRAQLSSIPDYTI